MKPLLSERNSRWGWGRGKWGRLIPTRGEEGGTPDISRRQTLQHTAPDARRKRAVEEELDSCRARLRTVEAQLLEVLQEKLRLKQEVEAWEVGWGLRLGRLRSRLCVPRDCLGPALSLSLLCPGRHAADGSRAGVESAAGRVQRHAGHRREPKHGQEFLDPTLPGSVGTTVVTTDPRSLRELSLFIKVLDHLCTPGPSQSAPLSFSVQKQGTGGTDPKPGVPWLLFQGAPS